MADPGWWNLDLGTWDLEFKTWNLGLGICLDDIISSL